MSPHRPGGSYSTVPLIRDSELELSLPLGPLSGFSGSPGGDGGDGARDLAHHTRAEIPTPDGGTGILSRQSGPYRHRRQLSLSSFSIRTTARVCGVLGLVGVCALMLMVMTGVRPPLNARLGWFPDGGEDHVPVDQAIQLGTSVMREGREVFWWEEFAELAGYYGGRKSLVGVEDWVSEQDGNVPGAATRQTTKEARSAVSGDHDDGDDNDATNNKRKVGTVPLVDVTMKEDLVSCYIDEDKRLLPPKLFAYKGLPQDFPAPLFGSSRQVGLRTDVCYDRINRFGPYVEGLVDGQGKLDFLVEGDTDGLDAVNATDYRHVRWHDAQERCMASQTGYRGPRIAFVIRTWHTFVYTEFHVMMLRAMISELALTSGGRYTVHFLIHVQDETIPIWASDEIYQQVLNASLPAEFAGMGTLWSVAQMKLVYPPPFPESVVNFSGDEVYKAYRSLHFALQYFAEKHPEFEHFWQWEMDMRVTGGYLELLERVTQWAERQERDELWEKSARFYIASLFGDNYTLFEQSVRNEVVATGVHPVSGPQLDAERRLFVAGVTDIDRDDAEVDLITFSPLFDPQGTRWAFHDDITGYPDETRPPTRAALVTASRLSRRLLLTMHHETFERKRTMFPEMFPASIALQYGYKAVYAPLPIYFDRDWPSAHADEVFNNAVVSEESERAGMDHGAGHFHGENGSVFGPGEHVFRGATWYSNALFAGYLWRRWLGRESARGEMEWEKQEGKGRMCLPMMVLHPVKHD